MNFSKFHTFARTPQTSLQGVITDNIKYSFSSLQSRPTDSQFIFVPSEILPSAIFSDVEQQNIEPLRNLILIMCLNSLKLLHWINSSFVFVKKMLRLIWYGEIYWNKNNIYVLLSLGIIYVQVKHQHSKFQTIFNKMQIHQQ